MANVIKTVITYPLNGSTRDFNIPFEYLARKFIQVTLIGRDRKPLTNIDDYRFTSKNQITTNRAWGTGDGYQLLELRRFTSATERLVDFSDGSILRAYDLNVSQIQTLHVAEEARDLTADTIGVNNEGHLDARGRRIVNLADPVNDLDAVNLKSIKEWNNSAYQSYVKAKEQADLSKFHAEAAHLYSDTAQTHKEAANYYSDLAKDSAKASGISEANSKVSENSARTSQTTASAAATEATNAKSYCLTQADRAFTEAERAKGYADSMGNTVDIGKVINSIDVPSGAVSWKGTHTSAGNYISNGLNFQLRPSQSSSGLALEMGWNVGASMPHLAWRPSSTESWCQLNMPYENGTLASREWINGFTHKDVQTNTSYLKGNPSSFLWVSPSRFGYRSPTGGDILTVDTGAMVVKTNRLELRGLNGFSGVELTGQGGVTFLIEAPASSPNLFISKRDSSGTLLGTMEVPIDAGSGALASQAWVLAQLRK